MMTDRQICAGYRFDSIRWRNDENKRRMIIRATRICWQHGSHTAHDHVTDMQLAFAPKPDDAIHDACAEISAAMDLECHRLTAAAQQDVSQGNHD